MTLHEFQSLIRRMYHEKDEARGVEGRGVSGAGRLAAVAACVRGQLQGGGRRVQSGRGGAVA
ncbi:MAG: hypothetical protein ACKOHG_15525, partial [Planctomycetia bacterium]